MGKYRLGESWNAMPAALVLAAAVAALAGPTTDEELAKQLDAFRSFSALERRIVDAHRSPVSTELEGYAEQNAISLRGIKDSVVAVLERHYPTRTQSPYTNLCVRSIDVLRSWGYPHSYPIIRRYAEGGSTVAVIALASLPTDSIRYFAAFLLLSTKPDATELRRVFYWALRKAAYGDPRESAPSHQARAREALLAMLVAEHVDSLALREDVEISKADVPYSKSALRRDLLSRLVGIGGKDVQEAAQQRINALASLPVGELVHIEVMPLPGSQ